MENTEKNFSKFGQQFQVTTLALFFKNKSFANRIKLILQKDYFDNKYMQWFCEKGLEYLDKYSSFPYGDKIFDNFEIMIKKEVSAAVAKLYLLALQNIKEADLSDRLFVEEEVENFCFVKHAFTKSRRTKK